MSQRQEMFPAFGQNQISNLWERSGNPIGEDGERDVFLVGIVVRDVNSEVMLPAHITVHHKLHRKGRRFTWLESHRTDDWGRKSTPLLDFNIRFFREKKRLIAGIGYCKGDLDRGAQPHITQIYLFFIHLET
jgi:hypothetical protein